ncbi:MFS transporter [Candidatus Peregrinibacteria bacterium]|nr:MAG: MFS transporter [Candidatus Peregrinibacteria bacterium]
MGQIPSGIFADKYGYKTTLVLSGVLLLTGTLLFAFSQGFYWFLVGYCLKGMAFSLKDGAEHALLYEGLVADKNQGSFKKISGKLEFSTNIFWVVTSISGGVLYSLNERLPFYAETGLVAISIALLLFLKEVKTEQKNISIFHQLKNCAKQTFNTVNFSKFFIFSAIIGSVAITTFQYLQPLYKSLDINESFFGLLAAGAFFMRGLGAWSAERVGKIFSVDKYLVLHASVFCLFLIFLQKTSSLFFVFTIIAILYFLRGLYIPTISTYINEKVDSSNRATMLSINSQILGLTSSISLFFTGYVSERYDLSTTFFVIGISSIIFLISYMLVLRKVEAD